MAIIDFDEVRASVEISYKQARSSILNKSMLLEKSSGVISDRIPTYPAKELDFGAFIQDEFTTLFADMRNSTLRAIEIGPEKTFLTLHAIMPTLVFIVEETCGTVVDLPGDGVMALFKENPKEIYYQQSKKILSSVELAFLCGKYILEGIDKVVNPILIEDRIPPVSMGVGIDTGRIIITKTGTQRTFDTKVIGDSVNNAAKLSNGDSELQISLRAFQNLAPMQQYQLEKVESQPYYAIKY